jgi:hypothetical protein
MVIIVVPLLLGLWLSVHEPAVESPDLVLGHGDGHRALCISLAAAARREASSMHVASFGRLKKGGCSG